MSSYDSGRAAETAAVRWLCNHGFEILERNWRTRWCEIDIIARRRATIHIIEVKFRRRIDFGTGFEHITPDKVRRLTRAAEMWMAAAPVYTPYQIDVMAISGVPSSDNVDYLPNAISA